MPTTSTLPRIVRDAATDGAEGNTNSDKSCTVTFTSPSAVSPPQSLQVTGGNHPGTYAICNGTFAYSNDPIQFPAKTNAKIKFDLAASSASGWQLCKFALLGDANGDDGLPGEVFAGTDQKISVTDNNQGATTQEFDYGILVINTTTMQCAGSDPKIINDGGGGPDDE